MLIIIGIYFLIGIILYFPVNFSKDGVILIDSIIPMSISYHIWILSIIFWLIVITKNHIRNYLNRRKNG